MLKIGVVGAGFIGMQHIESIRRIPGTRIVAITDTNVEYLKKLKSEGLCERFYTDFNEMFEKEKLDVVHNCTPTYLHYIVNKKAIENNIHIYSEKPLVKEVGEAEELVDSLQGKRLANAVNFNYRNNLLVQQMKHLIGESDFGRVLFVQGEYLQDWLMYNTDYDWRMDKDKGGKSRALADIGSHCFDLMEYVLSRRIISVNAKLFKAYDTRKKYEGVGTFTQKTSIEDEFEEIKVENEDGGVIQAEFEGGIIGSFTISQVSAGKKNGLKINVSGEKNALEWQQEQSDRLWIGHRDVGNEEIYADVKYVSRDVEEFATLPKGHPVGWQDALTNGIRIFYKSIKNDDFYGPKPYATFEDGYHIMKVVDACLESNEKNMRIKID
ncbi:MAG TPA: Gfo/Idh/MocA family oxidoreductase [Gallicola sp.]|nr:Gfo/Idh/MocA family oxidoreductase [Gallicola sp.]